MRPATLALNASSTLDLGAASSPASVKLGDSSAVAWTGTLTVAGWTYGTDHLNIGTSAIGLTSEQRGEMTFNHFLPGAVISSTGEISPHPYDVNQDSHVDVADVSAGMAGLSNTTTYLSAHPSAATMDTSDRVDAALLEQIGFVPRTHVAVGKGGYLREARNPTICEAFPVRYVPCLNHCRWLDQALLRMTEKRTQQFAPAETGHQASVAVVADKPVYIAFRLGKQRKIGRFTQLS